MRNAIKFTLFAMIFAFAPASGYAQPWTDTLGGGEHHMDTAHVQLPTGGDALVVDYADPNWLSTDAGKVALGTALTILLTYLTYLFKGLRNLPIEGSVRVIGAAIAVAATLKGLGGDFSWQNLAIVAPQLAAFATLLYGILKKAGLGSRKVAEQIIPS